MGCNAQTVLKYQGAVANSQGTEDILNFQGKYRASLNHYIKGMSCLELVT